MLVRALGLLTPSREKGRMWADIERGRDAPNGRKASLAFPIRTLATWMNPATCPFFAVRAIDVHLKTLACV